MPQNGSSWGSNADRSQTQTSTVSSIQDCPASLRLPTTRLNGTAKFTPSICSLSLAQLDRQYSVHQIGTPVGKHKVTILTPAPETEGTGERYKEKLPARYNRDSKMVEEVKGGNQTINFELTSDP